MAGMSKTQEQKHRIPWARRLARVSVHRPDPRAEIVRLIAQGLEVNLGGGGDSDPFRAAHAERVLAAYEEHLRQAGG
jgi:hypothetical protein